MIFIDASRSISDQKTGVEHYSSELLRQLVHDHPSEITLIAPRRLDFDVPQLILPAGRFWTQLRLSWAIFRNKKIDSLFIPSHVLPIIHPKNSVVTLHDVAFLHFPDSYPILARWYLAWSTRFALRHARAVIVPSEATRSDLVRFYKADPARIFVVPHGYTPHEPLSEHSLQGAVLKRYGLTSRRYFLYVGRIEPKKNLITLLRAFFEFSKSFPEYRLVLAGKKGPLAESIYAAAQDTPSVIFTDYIDQTTKAFLLHHASALLFPSLYEGFGFPLLEAIDFALPIVASDIPSSREVAEGCALFFPPADTSALITCLLRIAQEKGLRDSLILRQKQILSRYSWKQCAQETWNIIH